MRIFALCDVTNEDNLSPLMQFVDFHDADENWINCYHAFGCKNKFENPPIPSKAQPK